MKMLATLFIALSLGVAAAEETAKTQQLPKTSKETAGEAKTPETALIAVTLETSRPQSVLGTRLGVLGEIKNVSKTALRFSELDTVIAVPPEARVYGIDSPFEGCVFFPTEGNPARSKGGARTNHQVVIQPNESYRVFYDVGSNGCSTGTKAEAPSFPSWAWWKLQRHLQWQRAMFTPGPYKVVFAARFYDVAEKDPAKYHTASATQTVTLSAPQSLILLAAGLGGLIAFIVKRYIVPPIPDQAVRTVAQKGLYYASVIAEAFGAMLLSVVLVIIASRISDAFPVKVNANDFWGTITLGFIANYIGVAVIQRIIPPKPKTPA